MRHLCHIPLLLVTAGLCFGQHPTDKSLNFDLSQIGLVLDGKQICEDNGRLQDFPSKMMDRIIAAGPKAVPVLIQMLTDTRPIKTKEPLICYWPSMAVGDAAFCLLENLFIGVNGTSLPGTDWHALLGGNDNDPSWVELGRYVQNHGRKSLQAKWQALWTKYKNRIVWDPSERCFKLKAA